MAEFGEEVESYTLIYTSSSPEETQDLGLTLGEGLGPGDVVCLFGDLGAGKTCLAQGIAWGAGFPLDDFISSPTFTIINEYEGRCPIYHLDFYRIRSQEELTEVGYEEYLYGSGIAVVEWADRLDGFLPPERLEIWLRKMNPMQREITVTALGSRFVQLMEEIVQEMDPGEEGFTPQSHFPYNA